VLDENGCRPWCASDRPPPLVAAPVVDHGETFGWIAWVDEGSDAMPKGPAGALLSEIAAAASIPAANARRYADALDAALKDALTDIYNRRAFEEFLARETEASRRYGRALSLILVDVDRFKEVNDSWGHPTGDHALRRLARVLEEEARRSDIVARLGGDEFALIVPASDGANALRLGRRIVRRLERLEFSPAGCGELFAISASLGVADLQMANGDPVMLVELADRALLAAKRSGGGTIVCHEDGSGRRTREAPR
jgi:diguanylate cyclase (GGDEF)-like protein